VAPAAADSSSEEEDVLQVLEPDKEVTGAAAALARSSFRINQSKLVVKATRDPNGIGHPSLSSTQF
jgi:hypothetical protein